MCADDGRSGFELDGTRHQRQQQYDKLRGWSDRECGRDLKDYRRAAFAEGRLREPRPHEKSH